MKTIKLSELFNIYNGYASSNINLIDKSDDTIYYIRPSNKYEGTIAGYVNKNTIPEKYIFPEETIYVSTDGEGSHSYTYVSSFNFVPNSNVAVLIPKEEMTLQEKHYYALCITKNRYKFSYGRKPKGDRLANILLPDRSEIPDWVYEIEDSDLSEYKKSFTNDPTPELNTNSWKEFKISDLFTMERGKEKAPNQNENGDTPLINEISTNNGFTRNVKPTKVFKGNAITVSINFAQNVFYQDRDFCASVNIAILRNNKLNKYNGLFIAAVLSLNNEKYSYGYKTSKDRLNNTVIKLPATPEGEPDYQFMEDYMKTLPYSKNI